MTAIPPAQPLYLGLDPSPAFALFHATAGPAATAVLLCPPFGWEDMTSYRGRRDWAEQLGAAGFPALRIDLPATGDSAGAWDDPGLLDAWTEAVDAGARWLRARTGCVRVAVVGIGLGGFVACRAAGAGAAIDDLVLWGVPAQGRTLVRELRAFGRLAASRRQAEGAPEEPSPADGAIAAGGYVLSGPTRRALEGVDLTTLPPLVGPAPRALLLERDRVAPDAALVAALEAAGAEVAVAPGPGYAEMVMGDMQAVDPPTEVFAAVSAWLRKGGEGGASADAPVADEAVLELDDGVRETPLVLDAAGTRLFAVLSEPAGTPADLCAVLLNAGPQRRIGPNRMWVEIARRWAARGVPVLRLDVEGLGDATGAAKGWQDEPALYDPRLDDQVTVALDALEARGLPTRVVALGLCSGANWAFHAALRDERVVAAVLLNPRALFWNPWISRLRGGQELRRLGSRGMWRRIVRGEVSRVGIARVAGAAVRRVALLPLELVHRLRERLRPRAPEDELGRALRTLREASKRLVVVFCDQEPLRAELEADGQMDELVRTPGVTVETIASVADAHTLQPLWIQAEVHAIADRALEAELARARAAPRTPGRA
jgi:alpha-beta hydrolase superfamily lysophospholipase